MAKNISNNQWFKDIIDGVYLETAILNNILIVTAWPKNYLEPNATIAKIRSAEMFSLNGDSRTHPFALLIDANGNLKTNGAVSKEVHSFGVFALKTKQLETDFYSPEQLAEMYPNDPAYRISADELTDETKPVVDPVDDMGVT